MEIIEVKDCIEKLIKTIGETRREIETKGQAKARTISNYDRRLAVTIAELRNSDTYRLGEKEYKAPPATLTEKIAKGICFEERLAFEIAESDYKACISNLNALLAQLNGYQSIYRHLEVT